MDDAYLNAEAMFIQGKIDAISNFHISHQHSAAWKIINELSGRKDHPSIQLKGGSPEKRRENWLNHDDLTLASNYRGITLMPIAAKIYNKMILRRIMPVLDPLLRKNQNGFRKGNSFSNTSHTAYFGGNAKTQLYSTRCQYKISKRFQILRIPH